MANCLRMPMASSSLYSPSPKRRTFTVTNSAKLPLPPINPNDPFLAKLASLNATSPETLLNRPEDSDTPPFFDIFDPPKITASAARANRSVSYRGSRRRNPPPDLPSLLLDNRVVYIGMPLVPAVSELIIAELLYLKYKDPKATVYIYINSTGTTRSDGETVAMESEGFAIYDVLMTLKNEVHTIAVGNAIGHACLLLAAGTKGKRFMLPHAKIMIQQPRTPATGLMPASDVLIRAREVMINRDTLVELLAKHTGNSKEIVADVMRTNFYMNPVKAKEFGVIDKVLWRGQEEHREAFGALEGWDLLDKNAGFEDVQAS